MKREELEKWFEAHGWVRDRFGHYRKGDSRMKMQDYSVRFEKQTTLSDGSKHWVRVKGAYYSNLSLTPDGKLAGMKRGDLGLRRQA